MSDLIDRQAAIDAMLKLQAEDDETYGCRIPEGFDGDRAKEALEQLPSAQPDRKKGKWIETDKHDIYYQPGYKCSVCGVLTTCHGGYCPNCGADMRGEEDEAD